MMEDRNRLDTISRRHFVAGAGASAALTGLPTIASAAGAQGGAVATKDVSKIPTYGPGPHDRALRSAWRQFCATLQAVGEQAFKPYNPSSGLMRADAFRFITQNLSQAFEMGFETHDPKFPVIYTFCSPYKKLGGDNADCVYQQAWIDGESTYKISGNKGSVRFLNFTVMGERPEKVPGAGWRSLHSPFGDIPEANMVGHQIETNWDGSFELYIGGPRRERNWLPTTAKSQRLFIRQYFDDFSEKPARLRIERLGMTEPRPVPTPADMVKAMEWASRFMTGVGGDWPDWGYHFSQAVDPVNVNVFPATRRDVPDRAYDSNADAMRGRTIINMTWKLGPDEALIIEFDDEEAFWMLTNMGVFLNSMDYLYRPVSWTPSRTKVDPDGKIRFVLSHDDPGYHNWIDTSGFDVGNITSRNVLSKSFTDYRTKLVKRAELDRSMPAGSPKVTPEERSRLMLERFHGILERYALIS